MSSDWQKLDQTAALKILEKVNPHIEPVPMSLENTSVRMRRLPFYKTATFYEMTDLSVVPGARKYALVGENAVYVVNWTNETIYSANEAEGLDLTDQSITEYVKFFFSYVRGRHGRFVIIENFDEIKWQNEPPPQGRKVIQEMLYPVSKLSQDPDGTYNLEAFMLFKDSLFRTLVHVDAQGTVSMSDEELKIEGMPVIQDVMMA